MPPPPAATEPTMETKLVATVDVPAGKSMDVPVAFEGTGSGGLWLLTSASGVTATIGGKPLTDQEAYLGHSLTIALTTPVDQAVHIRNSGTSAASVKVMALVMTGRHLTMTRLGYIAIRGDTAIVVIDLTEAADSDRPTLVMDSPGGARTTIGLTPVSLGRWTADVHLTEVGTNRLLASVDGERGRFAGLTIEVASGTARIGAGFSERLEDVNDDGLADSLVLSPTITVAEPGTYRLNGRLFASDGTEVGGASAEAEMIAGSAQVDLEFNGTWLYSRGKAGPYRLAVLMFEERQLAIQDSVDDLGRTAAYPVTAFQHDPIHLESASFKTAAIDDDGDGKYERLGSRESSRSRRRAGIQWRPA
jgi:hypothetical protein